MDTLLNRLVDYGDLPHNVNASERWLSVIVGASAVLAGLSRGSLRGTAVAALGVPLILRGVTGHCATYGALGLDSLISDQEEGEEAPRWRSARPSRSANPPHPPEAARPAYTEGAPEQAEHDIVEEAGEESFPASDPPAWPQGEGS